MKKRKFLLVVMISLGCVDHARSQRTVLFEIGGSYMTNNLDDPNSRLYDFLAVTLNPRLLMIQGSNHSVSFDVPLSIRTKSRDDRNIRFGFMLPAVVMFNLGAGSVSGENKSALGFTAGGGWSYFHQSTRSEINEIPQYKESFSSAGPMVQAGLRIPHRKKNLFRYNEHRAYPVSVLKFSYLMNMSDKEKNIGSVSLLVGLGF